VHIGMTELSIIVPFKYYFAYLCMCMCARCVANIFICVTFRAAFERDKEFTAYVRDSTKVASANMQKGRAAR